MSTVDGVPTRSAAPHAAVDDSPNPAWTQRLQPLTLALLGLGALIVAASVFALWAHDALTEPSITIDDPLLDTTIIVAVGGAVATPGVYELPADSRVQHILDRAGGVLPEADLAAVNPALRVQDGEQILIPTRGEPTPQAVSAAAPTAAEPAAPLAQAPDVPNPESPSLEPQTLDINTASQAELESLPGIGPAKAAAIIAYRDQHGPFASVADLEMVDGISPGMIADLSPLIHVGP